MPRIDEMQAQVLTLGAKQFGIVSLETQKFLMSF